MKIEEKKLALNLRKQGWSMNDIKKELGISKSSVSLWVRNVELTKDQKQELSHRGIRKEVIEKRRETRLNRENARRQIIIDNARKDINSISINELKLIGASLYWAEGSKTKRGLVQLSNGDPKIIELMMRFFKEICEVPDAKFRGYIHIHPHLNIEKAEKYWSSASKISLNQFYPTYNKINKSSKNKKDTLPYGTFTIIICDTKLFLKIKGWIEGIYQNIVKNMPR